MRAPSRPGAGSFPVRRLLVPAQLAIQCGGVDPQDFGRARLVAPLTLEHPSDVGALDHVERGVRVRPLGHRSEEHTSELQSPCNLVCRLLLEKKKKKL